MNESCAERCADVASLLLANLDLPVLRSVFVMPHATLDDDVRLQLASPTDVATWAQRYGVRVVLRDRDSYVEVSATINTGTATRAFLWSSLRHGEAHRLAVQLGIDDITDSGTSTEPRLLTNAAVAAAG